MRADFCSWVKVLGIYILNVIMWSPFFSVAFKWLMPLPFITIYWSCYVPGDIYICLEPLIVSISSDPPNMAFVTGIYMTLWMSKSTLLNCGWGSTNTLSIKSPNSPLKAWWPLSLILKSMPVSTLFGIVTDNVMVFC